MSYNIGKPMAWAEFTQLPKDLKEEYMNNLIEKFNANARTMAEVFGVSVATVFRVVKNDGLDVKFLKGKHPTGDKLDLFRQFMDGDCGQTVGVVVENVDTAIETTEATNPVGVVQKTRLDSFTMNFSGEINIDMISNSLRYILSDGRKAKIQIICEIE